MKIKNAGNGRAAGSVTAVIVVVCLSSVFQVPAAWSAADEPPLWEEVAADRQAAADSLAAAGPEIAEPLFAFLTQLAWGDSLGTWTGRDIDDIGRSRGVISRFPVGLVNQVVRRRPDAEEQSSWPAEVVRAVWEVTLSEELNRPMPYSILGYHPGSLRVSRRLLMSEVGAGEMAVRLRPKSVILTDVFMLRLDEGHIILDVDGFVDHLLGSALDDAATVGFVLARDNGQLLGLAVSLGKNGRRIYGEFDFRGDKVLPNGRPLTQGLSAACRQLMLDGYVGPPLGAWVDE